MIHSRNRGRLSDAAELGDVEAAEALFQEALERPTGPGMQRASGDVVVLRGLSRVYAAA